MASNPPEKGLLAWLDGPRLVVSAFVLFMVGVLTLLLILWDGQREQIERVDAIVMERREEAAAANREQVNTCFSSAAAEPALRRALSVIEAQTENAKARNALADYRALNELTTPTFRECRQLANRLNVPIPKGIR